MRSPRSDVRVDVSDEVATTRSVARGAFLDDDTQGRCHDVGELDPDLGRRIAERQAGEAFER